MAPQIGVTPMRWWVLVLFSLFSAMQGLNWAIPGPVADATSSVYGWSADATSLLVNLGPIAFLPLSIPCAWLVGA
jgi:hypothetical protein